MVAKIVIGKSIRGILHYNENKVQDGEAKLILASGFAGDIERLDFQQKVTRFQHLNELRPTVKTNALHITLNFDSSEKLDNGKMQQIAAAYMERIGFGDQPFLVYRHNDAAHQHIHIATTSIQRDGHSINLHNIGRERSEVARKEIEKEFGLLVAESKQYKAEPAIKSADTEQAQYGHTPTKRAISNVLTTVKNTYAFTSLPELNAVLRQFNVIAERGEPDTEMFQNKGLVYSIIDDKGQKIGVPIKASAFHSKPTLRNLEKLFGQNEAKRKPLKENLMRRIDGVLLKYRTVTPATLAKELKQAGVALVLRQNDKGQLYGVTYVDHRQKAVFNGSDLGKIYSAKVLSEKLADYDERKEFLKSNQQQKTYLQTVKEFSSNSNNEPDLLETLLAKNKEPRSHSSYRKRKKKKQQQAEQETGYSL